jgi:hypothetical protein
VILRLGQFCQARSGDKADVSNVAVFAPTVETYELLREQLTAERVAEHLAPLVSGAVVRYEAANVLALNFVCQRALGGGGQRTLRSDMLGKTMGPNVLRMTVNVPDDVVHGMTLLQPS